MGALFCHLFSGCARKEARSLNIGLGAMCVLVLKTVYLFVFDMYGNVLGSLVGLVICM